MTFWQWVLFVCALGWSFNIGWYSNRPHRLQKWYLCTNSVLLATAVTYLVVNL